MPWDHTFKRTLHRCRYLHRPKFHAIHRCYAMPCGACRLRGAVEFCAGCHAPLTRAPGVPNHRTTTRSGRFRADHNPLRLATCVLGAPLVVFHHHMWPPRGVKASDVVYHILQLRLASPDMAMRTANIHVPWVCLVALGTRIRFRHWYRLRLPNASAQSIQHLRCQTQSSHASHCHPTDASAVWCISATMPPCHLPIATGYGASHHT